MSSGPCFSLCISWLYSQMSSSLLMAHGTVAPAFVLNFPSAEGKRESLFPDSYTRPISHSLWMRLGPVPGPNQSPYPGHGIALIGQTWVTFRVLSQSLWPWQGWAGWRGRLCADWPAFGPTYSPQQEWTHHEVHDWGWRRGRVSKKGRWQMTAGDKYPPQLPCML